MEKRNEQRPQMVVGDDLLHEVKPVWEEHVVALEREIATLRSQLDQHLRLIADLTQERDDLRYQVMSMRGMHGLDQEANLRTIIEHNADAIVVDSHGMVRFVNRAAERLFERSSEELLGNELGVPFVDGEKVDVDIFDRHGLRHVAEMRVVEIEWEEEHARLVSFRDVTARKQLEEELERKVEERTALLQHIMHQLSIQLTEREKAELAILRRDSILEAVGFAAQCFLKSTSFNEVLPSVLKRIGMATDVCRVALYGTPAAEDDRPEEERLLICDLVGEWIKPETCLTTPDDNRQFHRWYEQLVQGYPIYGDVRSFPPSERRTLEGEHIRSLIVVPVFMGQQWWGFVELDDCLTERVWTLTEGEALKAAASIMGSAIQMERMQEVLRTGEEQFRTVANFTYDWVYWTDPQGNYVYISPSCERLTGYHPDEFRSDSGLLEAIIHPQDRSHIHRHFCETLEQNQAGTVQFRIITRSGEERWFHHVCQSVYASDGRWLGRRSSNRDITEQVRLSEAYRLLVEHTPHGLALVQNKQVVFANPAMTHITGYAREELLAMSAEETAQMVYLDDRLAVQQGVGDTQEMSAQHHDSFRIVRKDGAVRWLETRFVPTVYRDQPALQITCRDITECMHAEELLRRSEERYRAFVEGANDLIIQVDQAGRIVYANHAAGKIFGVAADACIGRTIFDFVHPDDLPRTRMVFNGWVQRRATSATFENRQVNQETSAIHHMLWTINLLYETPETLVTINCIARDISEYKQVERALRKGESRYRAISELISDFAYALRVEYDGKLMMEWATDAFARTIGYTPEEVNAQGGWSNLIAPDDAAQFRQHLDWLLAGQSSVVSELRIITRQGETLWLRNHSRPVWDSVQRLVGQIYAGARNVTDRKKAEEELRKAHDELEKRVQERTAELARTNEALQKEIAGRMGVEEELRKAHDELEKRVQERTAELAETNRALQDEIAERKRIEDALRESEARYRILAESATDLISRHAPDGTYRYVSPACRGLLGYAPKQLLGHLPYDFLHPEDRLIMQASLALVRDSLTFNMLSYRIRHKDRRYVWFETSMKTVRDPETNEVLEIIAVSRDITERKHAEVLAAMSHDLLNPMQNLVHMCRLLLETGLDPQQQNYVETIHVSGERVLALINTTLESSTTEEGCA